MNDDELLYAYLMHFEGQTGLMAAQGPDGNVYPLTAVTNNPEVVEALSNLAAVLARQMGEPAYLYKFSNAELVSVQQPDTSALQ